VIGRRLAMTSLLTSWLRHIIDSIKTKDLYAIGHVKRGIYMVGKMEAKSFGIVCIWLIHHVYIMRAFPLLAIFQSQPSSYLSTLQ
jgi:hypothetical protein